MLLEGQRRRHAGRTRRRRLQATTLTIEVFYKPLGANSIYGKPTFGAAQKLFTMTAARAAVVKNAAVWSQNIADGKVPRRTFNYRRRGNFLRRTSRRGVPRRAFSRTIASITSMGSPLSLGVYGCRLIRSKAR